MIEMIDPVAFQSLKQTLLNATGLPKDALHVHIGLAIFIAVRLAWRRRGGWMVAWLVVLAAAVGGEWLDVQVELGNSANQPDASHWHDLWNTMLWPTVLLAVGRWLEPGFGPSNTAATPAAAISGDPSGDLSGDLSGQHVQQPLEQA